MAEILNAVNQITDPLIVEEDFTLTKDTTLKSCRITKDATLTVPDGIWCIIEDLELADGVLSVDSSSTSIQSLRVTTAGDNQLKLTSDVDFGSITVNEDAKLGMDKNVFDTLIHHDNFNSDGEITVFQVYGNELTQEDVAYAAAKSTVKEISFEQKLTGLCNLVFAAGCDTKISIPGGFGTSGNDTIKLERGASVTLGRENTVINLEFGKNSLILNSNSLLDLLSSLSNVSKIQLDSGTGDGATALRLTDVTLAEKNNGAISLGKQSLLVADSLTGSGKQDVLFLDENSGAYVGKLDFGANKNTVKVSKGAVLKVENTLSGVSNLYLSDGSRDYQYGMVTLSTVEAGELDGTAYSDNFVLGSYAALSAGSIFTGTAQDSQCDKITLGKLSSITAGVLDFGQGKNTLNLGNGASVAVTTISGVNKLTLANGCNDVDVSGFMFLTGLTADTLTGTKYADSFTVGNYAEMEVANLNFAVADEIQSDKLAVGSDSTFTAKNVDFGSGTGAVSVASRSTVTISSALKGVNKITLSNGYLDKTSGKSGLTYFDVAKITGTKKADNYSFGDYSSSTITSIKTAVADEVQNDKITIGKLSTFKADTITFGDGKSQLVVGNNSKAAVSTLKGINKLTVHAGSGTTKTRFTSTKITGTKYADTFEFGSNTFNDDIGSLTTFVADEQQNDKISLGEGAYLKASDIKFGAGKDNISIGQDSTFTADSIDFGAGKNTMSGGDRAVITVSGAITGLNKLTLANGSYYADSATTVYTYFSGGNFTGTAEADSIVCGRYASVTLGDVKTYVGNEDKADKIVMGIGGKLTAESLDFGAGKNVLSMDSAGTVTVTGAINGVNKITFANGANDSTTGTTSWNILKAGAITGTEYNDSFSFGNYSKLEVSGDVKTGDGNDKISFGHGSKITAKNIIFGAGKSSFVSGGWAEVNVTSIANVNKFVLSEGDYEEDVGVYTWSKLTAATLSGTDYNDTFYFGSYSDSTISDTIKFGAGNDTLHICDHAKMVVKNDLDFGEGKDTIEIGEKAQVLLTASDVSGLKKVTVKKSAVAYLSGNMMAKTQAEPLAWVLDADYELGDDTFAAARDSYGALNATVSGIDKIDFVNIGDATSLELGLHDGVAVKLWSDASTSVAYSESLKLADYKAISFEYNGDGSLAKYNFALKFK